MDDRGEGAGRERAIQLEKGNPPVIATAHHCIIFVAGIIGVTVAALTPAPFPLQPISASATVAASAAVAVETAPNAFTPPTRAEIDDFAARCPQFTA